MIKQPFKQTFTNNTTKTRWSKYIMIQESRNFPNTDLRAFVHEILRNATQNRVDKYWSKQHLTGQKSPARRNRTSMFVQISTTPWSGFCVITCYNMLWCLAAETSRELFEPFVREVSIPNPARNANCMVRSHLTSRNFRLER